MKNCVRTLIYIKECKNDKNYQKLLQIYDGNSCSAELYMLVSEVRNVRYSGQILAYQLAQDSRTCTMKNTYSGYAHQNRIIDKICDGTDGLVASHASHVDILFEVQLSVV